MNDKKDILVSNKSLFTKILNKLKKIFRIKKDTEYFPEEKERFDYSIDSSEGKKSNFVNSMKVEENFDIIYLKMKLENHEIRAINLTDEQIDKLQEIYDREILEKKHKINNLKSN